MAAVHTTTHTPGRNRVRMFAFVTGIAVASAALSAQDPRAAQRLFEAGQDGEALSAIADARAQGTAGPELDFLAGQARIRMHQPAEAAAEFEKLATSPERAWQLVGESAAALAASDLPRALDAANGAVAEAPGLFFAQYELGLVKARMEDWAGAAAAFGQAAELDPQFAYAHYYAGLSNSRIKRADRTAEYFERFVKLAPSAPERPATESLMRTLRGR